MMILNTDGKPRKTHLRTLSVLGFLLLLTHYCRGQSQLIGSSHPIVANLGDDIILPCYLEPAVNAAGLTLEWTRPDMDPRFVHVMRSGHELVDKKHTLFKGRTSMFTDEMKSGNISMKLSNVQLSDQGKYRCFIPALGRQAFVQLVFASSPSSPPVISLSGLDGQSGGVVLQCESAGWYPEPEVLWLDAEGKLLSAGPPETVRGPDDLYTVSSRVTVEKRPSNSFTCRVQHHNTTRTTQTQISISDDFFKLQSSSSSINIGLAVSLAVCILLMLAVSFFFLWREHIFKTKRKHSDEDQSLNEGESGQLMKPDEEQRRREEALKEQQRRREEAEKKVQTLKEQLQNKKKEVESKESELQGLHAEKQRNKKELQSLKGDLENKNKELWRIQRTKKSIPKLDLIKKSKKEEQKKKAAQEVETLKKELESRQKETDNNIRECEVKEAEVQQLQEEVQRMETSLPTLMESINMELERSRAAEASSSSSSRFKLKILSRNKWQEEQKRREEAETEVSILKLQNESRELEERGQAAGSKWKKTDEELEEARTHLESKEGEINQLRVEVERLKADLQSGGEEKRRREEEMERLHTDLQRGGEEKRRREEEMKEEMTERQKITDQKLADQLKKEKETQSLLEIQRAENSREKTELNDQPLAEKKRGEEARRHLKEQLDQNKEFEKKLQEEKRGREEADKELKDLKEEVESKPQGGDFGGSDNSQSVKPLLTPSTQTSDSGFNIEFDQQRKFIRLRNTSTKGKQMGGWELHLQVNDNKPFMHRFNKSSLKAGGFVTMWAAGYGYNDPPTVLVWNDLKSLSSGDKLQFVLFNQKQEIQHELCNNSKKP